MLKLATFNIYWLGNDSFVVKSSPPQEPRHEADWLSIARVISKLDADVIAFQEIVGLDELQKVLDLTRDFIPRQYEINDKQGQLLGAGMSGMAHDQKVVIAYDKQKFELIAASTIFGGQGRLPFGVRLRRKNQQGEFLVIGVHFKSGQPLFDNEPSAEKRARQCQHLADWFAGMHVDPNPILSKPLENENIAILGDFNAICELENNHPQNWKIIVDSLGAFRKIPMNEWSWDKPLADPNGGDRSSSFVEHLLIDFIMLSPTLKNKIIKPPTIYAFDKDPEIIGQAQKPVTYRVSDHRPVYVELDI